MGQGQEFSIPFATDRSVARHAPTKIPDPQKPVHVARRSTGTGIRNGKHAHDGVLVWRPSSSYISRLMTLMPGGRHQHWALRPASAWGKKPPVYLKPGLGDGT